MRADSSTLCPKSSHAPDAAMVARPNERVVGCAQHYPELREAVRPATSAVQTFILIHITCDGNHDTIRIAPRASDSVLLEREVFARTRD